MSRSTVVLSRFPAHFDATRPGKQLRVVADGVSDGLDDLSASLAGIRRAHRLGNADATRDIQLHGLLHRIGDVEFAPIEARIAALKSATDALEAAIESSNTAARDTAADALCDLLGVGGASPRLALFAPPTTGGDPPDLAAAAVALHASALALTSYVGRREAYRARVRTECDIHARGNGTVRALLEATASALDLEIDDERARSFKAALRPVVTVAQIGAAGTTTYSYVVVARSLSKNVDRLGAVATTATGNAALSASNANALTWETPPDARDFLVFRVANGADAANVGLLTATALGPTTTTFTDTGQAATGGGEIDPEVDDSLFHSMDRYWHAAFVHERAAVLADASAGEIIGMEENPVRRETAPDTPRKHAELFHVYRRGFGRSLLRIQVTGIGQRTIGPMLVNRDEGRGIGFAGKVPDGGLLIFDEAGHVTLDAVDVTSSAFCWQGAVFAANDDDPAAPRDFVFDGPDVPTERAAVFAVASPFDALDGAFTFPHAGDPMTVPGVGVGATRYGFFVQEAHFDNSDDATDPPTTVPISPRTHVAFADGSVFGTPPESAQTPAASVSLSWLEHEAYAVRILLPRRFSLFDDAGRPPMTELVRSALERHRPAGVDVRVEYVDDRWILGDSDVTSAASADPILSLRGGSVLWASPAPTP
jgi:hypothetical protein